MRDSVSPALDERDQELCARAAWLYHGAGLTQGEVAKRLGVPSVKAHRLIARANRLGFIHVSIDAPGYTAYVDPPSLKTMRERGEDPKANFARSLKADADIVRGFPGVTFMRIRGEAPVADMRRNSPSDR